jgi:UrcA family protein
MRETSFQPKKNVRRDHAVPIAAQQIWKRGGPMQMRSTVLALALGIGTMAVAVPALAGAPRERVPYGDLRLGTAEGQAELQKRLNHAAWKVCAFDESGSVRSGQEAADCYRRTQKDVAVQVAELTSQNKLGG